MATTSSPDAEARADSSPWREFQSGLWQSPYHDTMIDHDRNVGQVLKALDDLTLEAGQKAVILAGGKAIELDDKLAEALNNLGVLLRDRGELDEAVALLERIVADQRAMIAEVLGPAAAGRRLEVLSP